MRPSRPLRAYTGRHRAPVASPASRLAPPAVAVAAGLGIAGATLAAGGTASAATRSVSSRAASATVHHTPLLSLHSHGSAVRYLQSRLGIAVDGRFGVRTQAAVRAFQRSHGLRATGVADKWTWRTLPKVKHVSRDEVRPSTGAEGLNWAALARCEAGGNPRAVNAAGYYGLYQFDLGTWRGVGGSGLPTDASAEEQTYRAQLLFKRRGASPWPTCGHLLYS
ncbi:putative peptidoglycan binding protein [Motilibacter rhizosphaerae]|uniref:Putative peptidoglycan binding protein n=1 Tax=Motilibacter rhizosphaerae TaxID=598652 RepID=A0A4Q7NGE5_9ACTN|nr:transglycosylase family protein [Motilibacter rhizosphaerae]RZS83000.1 putative peptidoglycan binding protein [Motilibacter rhizosphaerae]